MKAKKKIEKKSDLKMLEMVKQSLLDDKIIDLKIIDIRKKSAFADFIIISTGTSNRHITALSNYLSEDLKILNLNMLNIEGRKNGDWIIVDIGDIIVHLFRGEVREYYKLEKMWTIN